MTSVLCGDRRSLQIWISQMILLFSVNIQQALQHMTDRLHLFGKKVGLRICGEKTKTMTVGNQTSPPITLEGQNIEKVDKFQYLGSYLSQNGDVEVDIRARLGKAWSVFQRLQPIWKCRMMSNYVCIRPLSFQLGYMPVKRGKQLTKSTRWLTFFIVDASGAYWASHGTTTSWMTKWRHDLNKWHYTTQ